MTWNASLSAGLPADLPAGAADPALEREAELVQQARTDVEAFGQLYRRHQPAIARYVRRRVGDGALAEDLVAETFLAALEALPRYRSRGLPFRAWLYRLATTRVNRWARRARLTAFARLEEEPLDPRAADGTRAAADEIDVARRALAALPPRYQSALALFYLEELSVDEVAAVLGTRPGSVKARLARGRERLRRSLAREESRS